MEPRQFNSHTMKSNYTKLIITLLLLLPCFVFALEVSYPTVNGTGLGESPSLTDLVKYAFNFAVAIGSVIAFMVIVYQGFNIANSGGESAKVDAAKNKIRDAFIGLVIILLSYIILTTINPGLIAIQGISLQSFTPETPETIPEAETPGTTAGTVNFQEIPLGTVIENAFASNIGCLDTDNNLLDCRTGKIIECYYENGNIANKCKVERGEEPKLRDLYNKDNSMLHCYDYDTNGDKVDILDLVDGRDRLDCFNRLLTAYQAKIETLQTYVQDLYAAINQCACSNCAEGSTVVPETCPSSCTSHCSCATGSNKDPCQNRGDINAKRERIKQLINGGKRDDPYYDWRMDPSPDPNDPDLEYNNKFMTIELFRKNINNFKELFQNDYTNIQNVKIKMTTSNPQNIISLAQLQNIQYYEKQSISITPFEGLANQKTDKYCRTFNCDTGTSGICNSIELNSLGRVCKIVDEKERYVFDGDGANFYYSPGFVLSSLSTDSSVIAGVNQKCDLVGDSEGNISLIPIGETVDDAEDLASEIATKVDNLVTKTDDAIGLALENDGSAYNLPNNCTCTNCVTSGMVEHYGCCSDPEEECSIPLLRKEKCFSAECTCYEKSITARVCPFSEFETLEGSLENFDSGIEGSIATINELTSSGKSVILSKLGLSRKRIESCVSGYGSASKPDIMQTRLFSCQEGVYDTNFGGLTITPDFPWPTAAGYYNCYPLNSEKLGQAGIQECAANPVGEGTNKCLNLIRDQNLMDNYYCCITPS